MAHPGSVRRQRFVFSQSSAANARAGSMEGRMKTFRRVLRGFAIFLVSVPLMVSAGMAHAAAPMATLRVGKAFGGVFDFTPLDVGMKEGFFKQHGLKIEEYNFAGSAKLQQALAANAIDVGLGSGPELAFVARGAPVKGVAAFWDRPMGS